jgi:hypothetical protein
MNRGKNNVKNVKNILIIKRIKYLLFVKNVKLKYIYELCILITIIMNDEEVSFFLEFKYCIFKKILNN